MKVIINEGFERKNAKLLITKNGQETYALPKGAYSWDVDTDEGDTLDVKLKCTDGSVLRLASFTCKSGNDICYIHPSAMYNAWMNVAYKYLPCLCIILYAIQPLIKSEGYKWVCTGMLVLTVLTFLALQISQLIPHEQKKLFKLDVIS